MQTRPLLFDGVITHLGILVSMPANLKTELTHVVMELGATECRFISASLLVPEERIRRYCYQDKCGCYDRHLMCPPRTGTVSEVAKKLQDFISGLVIQYAEKIDVPEDSEGVRRTKLKLHHIILEAEKFLQKKIGPRSSWGLIGGTCALCDECAGFRRAGCVDPDRARVSMEALGIDVLGLLKTLHLDNKFYRDKITWTGIVLMDRMP